jgi:hypothetical protein
MTNAERIWNGFLALAPLVFVALAIAAVRNPQSWGF